MIALKFRYLLVACLIVGPVAIAQAGETAMDWLMKMGTAVQENNYDGTFIYRHGDQIEAMRIVHQVKNGTSRERLVSLNGEAREIIRNDRDVICYMPDKQSVVIEHRKTREKNFPALLPDNVDVVTASYKVGLGDYERVATRKSRMVFVKPRDNFRYGYQLWADEKTGLLLKANLINEDRQIIEQFMFTQIDIGRPIKAEDLDPGYSGKKWAWHREPDASGKGVSDKRWKATTLPKGYRLTRQMTRHLPTRDMTVEHLIYSDGLAVVSVFIEPQVSGHGKPMTGATGMGAVNAFGTMVNGHQVTVVGEVPAATVALIGESIVYR